MKSIYLGATMAVMATAAWAADPKSDATSKSSDTSSQIHQLGSTADSEQNAGKSSEAGSKDLQQIKIVAIGVAKAFNDNDPQKAASLFAPDATVIDLQGKRADGRDQIQQQIKDNLNGPMKDQKFTFTNIEVRMIKPDVAYFDLDQESQGGKQQPQQQQQQPSEVQGQGGQPPRVHVTGLVVKKGGKWAIEEARPGTYLPEQPTSSS
jgi:uncharacterized protein (TIGR02246 family)